MLKYDDFKDQLLNDFKNTTEIDKTLSKRIRKKLRSTKVSDAINEMIDEKNFSSSRIVGLFASTLGAFFDCYINKKHTLLAMNSYLLNIAFPEINNITIFERNIPIIKSYIFILDRFFFYQQKHYKHFDIFPLEFIDKDDYSKIQNLNEYKNFLEIFKSQHIYTLMKLDEELTGHTTLQHISGVHAIALHVAKQLYELGIPVDIGLISGAAATHDIGKYGCIGENSKRVPYLHYYFTDQWTKKNNLNYIGHIATNHSVWDLELENLPAESLVLIYADFRVKNKQLPNNLRKMTIFNLKESFEVILNKLDNVDEKKHKRYQRVYKKLNDFEIYMKYYGISTDLDSYGTLRKPIVKYSILQDVNVTKHLKFQSISHNVHLMNILRTETSLSKIIEKARTENNTTSIQSYLQMFREYSAYLTPSQKLITLDFLFDTLINEDDDIRRQAASVIGLLIATYDEKYRKEIPKDVAIEEPAITSASLFETFLNKFLLPDKNYIESHKQWITHSIRIMLASLYANSENSQKKIYRDIFLTYYKKDEIKNDERASFYMLLSSKHIPFKSIPDNKIQNMYHFVLETLESENKILRISSMERIFTLLSDSDQEEFQLGVSLYLTNHPNKETYPSENYMKWKISKRLNINPLTDSFYKYVKEDRLNYSEIYLQNFKSVTHWMIKKIHIHMLKRYALSMPKEHGFYIAMHLCNLLKVSDIENVRNHAGDALVEIFPLLSEEQKNDVTIELLRALEIEGFRFTKYIPYYLGQILLYLNSSELDELVADIILKLKESGNRVYYLLLQTISIMIQHYPKYLERNINDKEIALKRYDILLGSLISGLVHTDSHIQQEAFSIIGKGLFNSSFLSLEDKSYIYSRVAKRMLILFAEKKENNAMFLNNAYALNHIYRFISDYTAIFGELVVEESNKIAFFPGTFDPFSLSHKKIAQAIRDMGFDVYLYVDEFSWSKRTQANKLRRKIIRLSIASELGIYVLPETISINIANPKDLNYLKSIFPNRELYIVIGSDVILNASSYKTVTDTSIHNINHIVFTRFQTKSDEISENILNSKLESIKGDCISLKLPPEFEDISSTQIRSNIDENRDISQLIDSYAMKYIYEYGLYRREPQYKKVMETRSYDISIETSPSESLITMLWKQFCHSDQKLWDTLNTFRTKKDSSITLLKNLENNGEIMGFVAFHKLSLATIYEEFDTPSINEFLRKNSCGPILCIDGILLNPKYRLNKITQILITETIAYSLNHEFTYALYTGSINSETSSDLVEKTFQIQGFLKISNTNVYAVSMQNPCTIYLDLKTMIKEPFANNPDIDNAINICRQKMQCFLTKLYPGNLLLSFDRTMMFNHLINKICDLNNVPSEPMIPRRLGELMSVPFGSILKGYTVPNTITKSMHTEKMFSEDLTGFTINSYPNYLSIENQIKMIRSFNRKIILVDDLLNKGYRINVIADLLKKEKLNVEKIIVGISTGRGIEFMKKYGYDITSAYYLPTLNKWFNENTLYPFIGGDTVETSEQIGVNLLPSINFILPYAAPKFLNHIPLEIIYDLSMMALTNSLFLMQTIENVYREYTKRPLTLKHLGEVFVYPRYPYKGQKMAYNLNIQPSEYLKNDLAHLKRIKPKFLE